DTPPRMGASSRTARMPAIVVSLQIWTSPNSPLGRYPNRLLGPVPRQQLALLRGGPSPHPVLLACREREIPAFVAHLAAGAHPFGPGDLRHRRAGRGHREEQVGVGGPACGTPPPFRLV